MFPGITLKTIVLNQENLLPRTRISKIAFGQYGRTLLSPPFAHCEFPDSITETTVGFYEH